VRASWAGYRALWLRDKFIQFLRRRPYTYKSFEVWWQPMVTYRHFQYSYAQSISSHVFINRSVLLNLRLWATCCMQQCYVVCADTWNEEMWINPFLGKAKIKYHSNSIYWKLISSWFMETYYITTSNSFCN
jgi:hypothetical protein